ncbi:MAG: S8 family serine peptidase [Halobacteriovoraceae bacterium]|jgi:hypothetical protein|nr:S8 family serine peptidase [Halobacteriovoraceae bacterium]
MMKILFILLLGSSFALSAHAEKLLLEVLPTQVKKVEKKLKGKLQKFTTYKSNYFDNLYEYEVSRKNISSEVEKIQAMSIVKSVEKLTQVSGSSIEIPDITIDRTKDPLFIYQWGLAFNGQRILNELTGIKNIELPFVKDSDIGIKDLADLTSKFKKDVLVAVIDTGVDYNHPDLKANIYTNELECIKGEIPFEPETNHDDNEYAGDCKGWNFTGKKDNGSNRPDDFVGHGTHISGIIAGVRNNNYGISGVSNRIKILPIKVLSNTAEDSQTLGTSDRLIKAILYAVQMKADVINLSLGWPLSFDKKHLIEAVQEAVKNGVTVVAAAGNNDHSEPIMPCGYEGVICVGSSDPDKSVSDFSNFGAHVDVLAPGNNILSTYPTANTPLFFDTNGFEIKSGTSQSTPYVSALVASIKGIYAGISEQEVRARVLGSTVGPHIRNKKFANGSLINFNAALVTNISPMLKPSFKGFNRVKIDAKTGKFNFEIKFEHFGTIPDNSSVTIHKQKNIKFDQYDFLLNSETLNIIVTGTISDLTQNLTQQIRLSVVTANKSVKYLFEKRFYIDFTEVSSAKRYEIIGANPKSVTNFETVHYMHHKYDFPFYYTTTKGREPKDGVFVSLFSRVNDKVMNLGRIRLPRAKSILSVHRVDANLDGKADILIRSLIELEKKEGQKEAESTIMYSYLTEKLRPLFFEVEKTPEGRNKIKSFSHMQLRFEKVILQDLNDFSFGIANYGKYGKVLVPVYKTFGDKPKADTNPNPFARLRKRVFSDKIYYYDPVIEGDKSYLITRTINDNSFIDAFKRKIRFKPFEQVFVVKFAKQSFADIKAGKISLLLSHESERKLPKNYVLTISDLQNRVWSVQKTKGEQLNLSSFISERSFMLDAETVLKHDVQSQIIGYQKSTKLSWQEYSLHDDRVEYVSIDQNNILDPLELPIQAYTDGVTSYRFFQTPSRIFLEKNVRGEKIKYSFPVHISSFLPGVLFREQHYPISFVNKGKKYPALYVDSTQISSRNIYLITVDGEKIYAPINFNFNIPKNCKALNPVIIEGYKYEYSIQCFSKNGGSELIYVPLEV